MSEFKTRAVLCLILIIVIIASIWYVYLKDMQSINGILEKEDGVFLVSGVLLNFSNYDLEYKDNLDVLLNQHVYVHGKILDDSSFLVKYIELYEKV